MKLSIIVPCFNEQNTIYEIINKILVLNINLDKELIIVDDGSYDKTRDILNLKFSNKENIKIHFHKKNLGKGAAIRTAKKHVSGEIIIIQDADLEYDPKDYQKLLLPILNKESKVVYGSRVLNQKR